MRNITVTGLGILLVLLFGPAVQAELQFVDNFEGMTVGANMPYNVPTAGGGGIWSTNTGGTSGNIYVETNSGSTVIRFMTTSDGANSRGFGFADIDNAIENTESGILFFRFCIRVEANAADTYFGIHALSGVTPFAVAGNSPQNYIVAGFRAVNGAGTSVDLVAIKDPGAVLLAGLTRGQWYNCWIDADNAANTFDLYISPASGPAGPPTLPTQADRIADDLPFENTATYGNSPLMGAFFDTPRLSSTTRSTTQSARTFIDEVWWDGDAGLVFISKGARNPVPANNATEVPLDQVLSWDAPDDPNVQAVLGYDVYFSSNQADVQNGEPSALVSAGQTALSYKPVLAYDAHYFWRVTTTVQMDDPNHTVLEDPGRVWSFETMHSLPIITQQPADVIAPAGQTVQFAIAAESILPASYQWYKSSDRTSGTPDDDTLISGASSAVLTLSTISISDEAYYYCKVYNPSVVYSNAASLGVKRE
ncbi:MAG TPA: immunoglobulin domain-containing protein, partial [Anaerohalosphaeraceae bacterium]|nr:immunoglobulin domain-containing protein [Anaerohalosphaeraceae bacterium]